MVFVPRNSVAGVFLCRCMHVFRKRYLVIVSDQKLSEELKVDLQTWSSPQSYKASSKISLVHVVLQYFHHSSRLLSPGYGNRAFQISKETWRLLSSTFSLNQRGIRKPERRKDLSKVTGNFLAELGAGLQIASPVFFPFFLTSPHINDTKGQGANANCHILLETVSMQNLLHSKSDCLHFLIILQ